MRNEPNRAGVNPPLAAKDTIAPVLRSAPEDPELNPTEPGEPANEPETPAAPSAPEAGDAGPDGPGNPHKQLRKEPVTAAARPACHAAEDAGPPALDIPNGKLPNEPERPPIRLRFVKPGQGSSAAPLLARVVRDALRQDGAVELEGLGVLLPRPGNRIQFVPDTATRVFIAYAFEDAGPAVRLERDLADAGFHPWLDRNKLLPGQRWHRCIERAIETADVFIPCFSPVSAGKRGYFPYELRYALRCASRMPLDDSFLFPVRFEPCAIPRRLDAYQYVNLYPDWNRGFDRLAGAIRAEMRARRQRKDAA